MTSNPISIHLKSVKQFIGDTKQNINTISGNLENIHKNLKKRESVLVKRNIFGKTWTYKLNKNDVINKNEKCIGKRIRNCVLGFIFVMLLTAGLLIAFGPQLFDIQQVRNGTYLFKTVPPRKLNKTRVIKIEKTVKSIEGENSAVTLSREAPNETPCSNCTINEICFKIPTEIFPKCVPNLDVSDPTGCGGLCLLEKQSCKKLDDELNIFTCIDIELFHCEKNQFKCLNNLMCISSNLKCNGIINCLDYSDEKDCDCDLNQNFRCGGNISCIPNGKKCDGSVDCWDASDETSCIQGCPTDQVPCYNGECIEKELFCNGKHDCEDKSDEPTGCIVDTKN